MFPVDLASLALLAESGEELPTIFGLAVANPVLAMVWAGIAQGKGRSGLAWGLLSLFFPILSWAVLLILKPAPREIASV